MSTRAQRLQLLALQNLPVVLLVVVFLTFAALDPRFFDVATLANVARQASFIGVVAVGITLVLLTAGIDLSVGSMMYLSAVLVGRLLAEVGMPVFAVVLLALLVGGLLGAVNAFAITRLRIIPFIVTLATLTLYRGWALSVSRSQNVNYPREIRSLGSADVLGVPVPVIVFAVVVLVAHLVLTRTPFGRQVYAVGEDAEQAERAGVDTRRVLTWVYVASGVLAALGGFVAIGQQGIVTPGFGEGDEFDAIAAAVLGGTSLFGGRGTVFPGTVVGALLIQVVAAGLVFLQVDLYLEPLVTAGVIFLAVLLDSLRARLVERLQRRRIRPVEVAVA